MKRKERKKPVWGSGTVFIGFLSIGCESLFVCREWFGTLKWSIRTVKAKTEMSENIFLANNCSYSNESIFAMITQKENEEEHFTFVELLTV